MHQRFWLTPVIALGVFLLAIGPLSWAAEGGGEEAPEAITVVAPDVPLEELELMLKPLTKSELLVEAEAWQELLKTSTEAISAAEIAVQRQNREIEKAKQIQDKAEEAKEELEKVKEKADEAKASGDAAAVQETQEAVDKAKAKVEELETTVEEAAAAAERTVEAETGLSPETAEGLDDTAEAAGQAQEALGRVQEVVEEVDTGDPDSVREAATDVRQATEEAKVATEEAQAAAARVKAQAATQVQAGAGQAASQSESMERTVEVMDEASKAKKEEKIELLEEVAKLREERIQIIDRLNAVLDELDTKTDETDADTQAQITDYRLYISAVRGIKVDVKDTTSAWIAIKGWLSSEEGGLRWAQNFALFFGILFIAWFLSRLFSRMLHRALKIMGGVSRLLEDFLVRAIRWVVMIVGVIMALAALEVSIGPLLAVVGAAGFVIAFALQDSLSNFASGLMILFFKPFDVGDVVDAGGVSGSVTSMNLVSTSIKTFDNKKMVVPNNKIWNDVITNATGVDTRRVDLIFGIGYADDIDKAQAILEDVVNNHPKVLKSPAPVIRLHALADSSVNFICRPWAKTVDYWDVHWDLTRTVKQRFDKEGVGIPFPQRDVHLYLGDPGLKKQLAGLAPKKPAPEPARNPQPFEMEDEGRQENSDG